jgi:hypothetical protein
VPISIRCSVPLVLLIGALGAEDVDVVTLSDGAVLIGSYEAASRTLVLMGGASGTAFIDPATVVSVKRRPLVGAAAPAPQPAADAASREPAWTGESAEAVALRQTVADDRKKVDELTTWLTAVQDSVDKAKTAAADAKARREREADQVAVEKGLNGKTSRESEQRLDEAVAADAKAGAALPLVEAELRQSQARLEIARKALARDLNRLQAAQETPKQQDAAK